MLYIFRAVRFLDVLAPPVTLNIGGHQTLKTVAGGLVSMVYVMVFAVAMYRSVVTFLDDTSPTVTRQVSILDKAPEVNLVSTKSLPIVTFYRKGLENLKIEESMKYVTIDAYTVTYISEIDPTTNKLTNKASFETVQPVACSILMENGTFYDMYKNVDMSETYYKEIKEYGLCLFHPDYKNESILQVKGSYEEGAIKSLRIDG